MKTYIWNLEYEVGIANAETLEEARELLIENYGRKDSYAIIYFKTHDPDIILEPNAAICYEHANE